MGKGFEGEVTFFSFYWFVRCFFYEFHTDIGPMEGNRVTLKHYKIRVFDVELDRSNVLDTQNPFSRHVLNQKLILACVFDIIGSRLGLNHLLSFVTVVIECF